MAVDCKCSPSRPQDIQQLSMSGGFRPEDLELAQADLISAISSTRPSVSTGAIDRYAEWDKLFGSS